MIESLKPLYEQSASVIDWKNKTKNQLVFEYIENEHTKLKDAYFSAIVLKYWHLIGKYYKMSYLAATEEDCYDWLVESILYAISHRRWQDKDSSIYNDPNGPDKVINRHMACLRYTFYQAINRQKRKDGFNISSLDAIFDDFKDHTDVNSVSEILCDAYVEDHSELDIKRFIKSLFSQGDYLSAYIVHLITYKDVFSSTDDGYSLSFYKLTKAINKFDDKFCEEFSEMYDIPIDTIKSTLKYFEGVHSDFLEYLVSVSIRAISNSPYMVKLKEDLGY